MKSKKKIVINSSVEVIEIETHSLEVQIETIDSNISSDLIESTIIYNENIKVEEKGKTLFIKEENSGLKNTLKNMKNVVDNNMIINGKLEVNSLNLISSVNDILSNNRRIKLFLNANDKFNFIIKTVSGNVIVNKLKNDVLTINTTDGNVSVDDSTMYTFGIQTINGAVNLNGVVFDNSLIYTEGGSISLNNLVSTNCHLSTKSGDISLNEGEINNCQLISNNGNIDFKNFNAARLSIRVDNGDIVLKDINVVSTRLNSLCGNVRIEVLESLLNYKTKLLSLDGTAIESTTETIPPIILDEKNKLEVKTKGNIKVLFKGKMN